MPSWQTEVRPVIDQFCAPLPFPAAGRERATETTYSTLAGVRLHLNTERNDVLFCTMPIAPGAPLPPADWATLLEWYACGGPDN